MGGWAVVQTHVNRERVAAENAANQGYEVWNLRASNHRPLFPRYLLVLVAGAWRSLLSTRGIAGVLRRGPGDDAEPSYLRDREVLRLQAMTGPDGLVTLPPRFEPGERVEHRRWGGVKFLEMAGPDRSLVLLSLLGREVRLVVDEKDLEAA